MCAALSIARAGATELTERNATAGTMGDKAFASLPWLQRVASHGVVCVSANYRMSPEVTSPSHVVDCKRALVWVKRNAAQWNGAASKVFVAGESAGGHLSALVAVTPNFARFQPPEDPAADTSVCGAVPHCGVYDWGDERGHLKDVRASLLDMEVGLRPFVSRVVIQKRYADARPEFEVVSPTWHLRRILADSDAAAARQIGPLMVLHGDRDALTALADGQEFFRALQAVRQRFGSPIRDVFVQAEGGFHAFGYWVSPRQVAMSEATVDFIRHHSGEHAAAHPPA